MALQEYSFETILLAALALAIVVTLVLALLKLVWLWWHGKDELDHLRPGHCSQCGYDLRIRTHDGRCPDCGKRIDS